MPTVAHFTLFLREMGEMGEMGDEGEVHTVCAAWRISRAPASQVGWSGLILRRPLCRRTTDWRSSV